MNEFKPKVNELGSTSRAIKSIVPDSSLVSVALFESLVSSVCLREKGRESNSTNAENNTSNNSY